MKLFVLRRRGLLAMGLTTSMVLVSCAGMPTESSVPLDYAGADAGKVVIGIGYRSGGPGTYYHAYRLYFRSVNGTEKTANAEFSYKPGLVPFGQSPDYKTRSEQGVVVTASLPPGDYVITNFNAFTMVGNTAHNFGSQQPLTIRFRVEARKLSYLGNFRAQGVRGKNLLGMPLPAGVTWDVGSRAEEDLKIARARDAKLPTETIDQVPTAAAIGNPLFSDRKS